ncbi:MAG: AAA family ATPase [Alphaproteobacteria bacterium]|nr:AAA family ATPase [Alphaproteobacteria bacterium]
MSDAMRMVRDELGDESIIVSTSDNGADGVRITAAIEEIEPEIEQAPDSADLEPVDNICNVLDRHGVPRSLSDQMLNTVAMLGGSDSVPTLAGALDLIFEFNPLPETTPPRPLMLVGPPGTGKTSAMAKLATRLTMARSPVALITTDQSRAGAVEQISAYAQRLNLTVKATENPRELTTFIEATPPDHFVLIDSTGTNPYDVDDMAKLLSLVGAADIDPILVLDAGRDAVEAARIATAFQKVAPRRLLVTGLDLTQRLGAALAAADACQAAFCDFSATPNIADGLQPLNPVSLARLLLDAERLSASHGYEAHETPKVKQQASGWN